MVFSFSSFFLSLSLRATHHKMNISNSEPWLEGYSRLLLLEIVDLLPPRGAVQPPFYRLEERREGAGEDGGPICDFNFFLFFFLFLFSR